MRVFIASDFPEEVKKELARLQDLLPEFKGKKTENFHLTLKFLGEVSPETLLQIKSRLQKISFPAFRVHLGEIGIFTPKHVKIILIKLIGAEKLQEAIDNALSPLFKKESRFMAHITLARIKAVGERKDFLEKVSKIKTKWMEFSIDKFVLKTLSSDAPVYEDLESYNLN